MSQYSDFPESDKSIRSERGERKDCCGSCSNEVIGSLFHLLPTTTARGRRDELE
jgi:hypothetical protein